ncbi:MAG: M24 family metallopeptidase [Actinomycetota bacterium]
MSSHGPFTEPYPRFSAGEMKERRASLERLMTEHQVAHLILYGANRFGSAVAWLTRWPVTREALVVVTPGEPDVLFVHFYNHVPLAQRLAADADVRWAGETMATAIGELERRGARGRRVGFIGPLGYAAHHALAEVARELVDLSSGYTLLRTIKSAEELEWLRVGTALTDDAMRALQSQARPGMTEHELGNLVERAYVGRGGTTHIHYFGMTPMRSPAMSVPAQWASKRSLAGGDVLTSEISASFWDYPGQLLRTFSVADEPVELYRELHAAADAAFDAIIECLGPGATAQEVVDASTVIEDADFTTRDDLVHGFVGGYLPPILGSTSRALAPVPDFTFEAGMAVVVQPNVVTHDERAGVQTGELVLVTNGGPERLHNFERGLLRIA